MKSMIMKIWQLPTDTKLFLCSIPLLIGIFLFPQPENHPILFTMYILSIFISTAISAVFMTYVRDSEYNIFRNQQTLNRKALVLVVYISIVVFISYILAMTEIFLDFY